MAPSGGLPPDIHCARDYERLAARVLDAAVLAHLSGGAGRGRAAQANLAALDAVDIVPRMLVDLAAAATTSRFGGRERPHPLWLAPLAFQGLFHANGEVESARAAAAVGAGMVLSTLSSQPLEAVAAASGGERWFQLYVQPSRSVTEDLVRRVEASGYDALVLTVDTPVQAPGLDALRAGFVGGGVAGSLEGYDQSAPSVAPGESRIFQGLARHAPTWADIAWLRERTRLPVWLKGVLHPDDARRAVGEGIEGLVVSNHGGRTLDSAVPSLGALPAVRQAVGDVVPILFDGGVRSGEDVFKAIALGADAVMVGRLQACALAVGGALGVAHMIRTLREELEVCMALAGCASLDDVRRADTVTRRSGC